MLSLISISLESIRKEDDDETEKTVNANYGERNHNTVVDETHLINSQNEINLSADSKKAVRR